MSVKIVAYDLTKPKYYYKDLMKAINRYKSVKVTESLWFINTEEACEDVFRNLEIYVHINDSLFIEDMNEKEITGMNLLSSEEDMLLLFK